MKIMLVFFLFLVTLAGNAQDIKIEFDKNHDFSSYKTFSLGESEIILSNDEETIDKPKIDTWVKDAIASELEAKGLKKTDSAGDLTISYVINSVQRSQIENVGPLGGTPGVIDQPRSSMRDYNLSSFIIDLKNKSNDLVWRVNAQTRVSSSVETQEAISEVVTKGFKNYGKPSKNKRRK